MKLWLLLLVLLIISVPTGRSIEVENVKVDSSGERFDEGLTRYIYGSSLVASVKDSSIKYYHSDMIQSNRLVTDSSGDVENEFKSLPFGQEVKNEGIRYAFATGKELDESELHYFGARYYDSNVGRFTSVDPIQSEPAYQYVRNSPLILIDPNGDFPFSVLSEMMIPHPTLNEYDSLSEAMNSAKKMDLSILKKFVTLQVVMVC